MKEGAGRLVLRDKRKGGNPKGWFGTRTFCNFYLEASEIVEQPTGW